MSSRDKTPEIADAPSPKRAKLDEEPVIDPIALQPGINDDEKDTVADALITETSPHGTEIAPPSNVDEPVLSKRARKKALKLAEWQVKKIEKRSKEREKYRQRRADAFARGEPPQGPSRKALKHNTMAASTNAQRIVIDMSFDALMIPKDVCKCAKQLLWVYTINRKSPAPAQCYFTGLQEGGEVQQALQRNDGYRNWDVHIDGRPYGECFDRERLVYLTSDSDTVLERLDADDVYVIGGLVDHNHHKGLTLRLAEERGIRTARLPLGEHVQMKTRTVLTIVHVYDILLRVSLGESWTSAILAVLPSRKNATAKSTDATNESDGAGDQDTNADDDTNTAIVQESAGAIDDEKKLVVAVEEKVIAPEDKNSNLQESADEVVVSVNEAAIAL